MGTSLTATAVGTDSLLHRLRHLDWRTHYVGDETWGALFPALFTSARPFPSFAVRDLHTVDDGVKAHLIPDLIRNVDKQRGDLIVGHYLGVDHAGHMGRVDDPPMLQKLNQMDVEMVEVSVGVGVDR